MSTKKKPKLPGFSEQDVLRLAEAAYSQNPTFAVDPKKTALLVIDMQDEFVKPHWTPFWVPSATRITRRVRRLIDFCRSKNIPVIFTVFSRTHSFLDRPKSSAFMPNRYHGKIRDDPSYFRDGRIWHELSPLEDEVVIHKPSYGAFFFSRISKETRYSPAAPSPTSVVEPQPVRPSNGDSKWSWEATSPPQMTRSCTKPN